MCTHISACCVFVVSLTVLLAACGPQNRTVAQMTVERNQLGTEVAVGADVPENPIVIIRQNAGFGTWQEVLDAYATVTLQIDFTEAGNGVKRSFVVGDKLSENAGYYASQRSDKSWDLGARFIMPSLRTPRAKLVISDPKGKITFPLEIRIERPNELR